ncbi:MAG: acylphosphatase [Gammaproteobacteria bacterium]
MRGRVQRVAFRASTRRKARTLAIAGSATNQADGSVVVIAQGEESQLKLLLEWLHRGPALARVDGVAWEEQGIDELLGDSFREA